MRAAGAITTRVLMVVLGVVAPVGAQTTTGNPGVDAAIRSVEEQVARANGLGDRALALAGNGQYGDYPEIQAAMATLLGVGEPLVSLYGEEDGHARAAPLGDKAEAILHAFSEAFSSHCYEQRFPMDFALMLEQQNQRYPSPVSVGHCANRTMTAVFDQGQPNLTFKHCGTGQGEWRITMSGMFSGLGRGTIDAVESGHWVGQWSGDAKMLAANVTLKEAGAFRLDALPPSKLRFTVAMTFGTAAPVSNVQGPEGSAEVPITTGDKPCRIEEPW